MKSIVKYGWIACTLILAFSCDKENVVQYEWDETKCADPWQTNEGDTYAEVEEALMNYLSEEGVNTENITITNDPDLVEFCEACPCKTGDLITVTVKKKEGDQMEGLNFRLKE